MNSKIVIVGAKRTPIGSFQGQFSHVSCAQLGAASITGAMEQAGIGMPSCSERWRPL